MSRYYQPEIETAPREKILEIQNEKIVRQVKHVWDNVPYYRDLMMKKGVTPDDIKGVDESLVMEDNGSLVALVKFQDYVLNWDQEREDQFIEKIESLKKSVQDFVNRTVGKNSKIDKVEVMKDPFEKTATQKIRRFKYSKDTTTEEGAEKEKKQEERERDQDDAWAESRP